MAVKKRKSKDPVRSSFLSDVASMFAYMKSDKDKASVFANIIVAKMREWGLIK